MRLAIALYEPAARPRENSSRSASERRRSDHVAGGSGRRPPLRATKSPHRGERPPHGSTDLGQGFALFESIPDLVLVRLAHMSAHHNTPRSPRAEPQPLPGVATTP